MIKAGEADKLHIAILGRKNVGKSLLINRIVSQELFVVNEIPGTIADPVSKAVELLPYGPVVIIDTAGIDDNEFDKKRLNRTVKAISSADFAILVLDARDQLDKNETDLITNLQKLKTPFLVAVNKIEFGINSNLLTELEALEVTHFELSCKENAGIENFKKKLVHLLPGEKKTPLIKDLVTEGDVVVLVVPDNLDELHGSVFKSQIKKIQEELGEDIVKVVVKEYELASSLIKLKNPPELVIADSHIIRQVAEEISESVKLTTYSIVMTRHQGNLSEFVKGIKKIEKLENGDKVLISEGCNNHLQEYEIGKIKIQEWLKLYSKKKLQIDYSNGCGFPDNLSDYNLIVHCDGCSISNKIIHTKVKQAKLLNIPIINYGVLTSFLNHTISRSILPFTEEVTVL
ncbi:MAG: [FeFe] hydrogenase H-cluster maturation GTPase HydF [Ignavibacteriaceae bacterium]|jgi:[FeFe] hydrogenase H-cluster maturation GTPase HydF|nr:[FeFe] hydrogenase H-cluster maturation GTPase HydF [Ignavibacteriaceae bacterium]